MDVDLNVVVDQDGRITLPQEALDALGIRAGDNLLLRLTDGSALIARTPHPLELAGVLPVPPALVGVPWDELLERAYAAEAARNL